MRHGKWHTFGSPCNPSSRVDLLVLYLILGFLSVFHTSILTSMDEAFTNKIESVSGARDTIWGKSDNTIDPRLGEIIKSSLDPNHPEAIKVAACHKTLFGNVDLISVLEWVVYNRLLGVDHFRIYYMDDIVNKTGFAELQALPYVQMELNTEVEVISIHRDNDFFKTYRRVGFKENSQWKKWAKNKAAAAQRMTDKFCLQDMAGQFDWVMFMDADEYLWFQEPTTLKQQLVAFPNTTSYLSFGKYIYTTNFQEPQYRDHSHKVSAFSMADFPFTLGPFCEDKVVHNNRSGYPNPICPAGAGRSKVIVRPSEHKDRDIEVHGWIRIQTRKTRRFAHVFPNHGKHMCHFLLLCPFLCTYCSLCVF